MSQGKYYYPVPIVVVDEPNPTQLAFKAWQDTALPYCNCINKLSMDGSLCECHPATRIEERNKAWSEYCKLRDGK